jgi:hypothetical protein
VLVAARLAAAFTVRTSRITEVAGKTELAANAGSPERSA